MDDHATLCESINCGTTGDCTWLCTIYDRDPMARRKPVLQVTDLTFRRGRPILRGINWTVVKGQHWAILGPNGCGKTSLINIITGYDSATSGEVVIDGARYGESDWREVRKRVGIVANTLTTMIETGEPVINVIASGRDAKLNLWQDPDAELLEEAHEMLEAFSCGYLKTALWGPLSVGEKQKVLICRALMARFEVLILDEPCAGLDPVARERFLYWLGQLMALKDAPSLVMVTHHVEEILPAMGHVLMLAKGKTLASGLKSEILTSKNLSKAYGAAVELTLTGDRYALRVKNL
jgi:iron complex transport system ATP-binding protein